MSYGYWGKILEITLDDQLVRERKISDWDYQEYFGGSGIASKILYSEYEVLTSPLSPDNPLIFFAGLLTGTQVPTACKISVVTKSPLTGIWGESTVGGFWGAELKKTGIDGVIIKGRAVKPTAIFICDGQVQFIDASDLIGLDTYVTEEKIRERTDEKAEVACIGPAGENLVDISGIAIGGYETRMAGRCGVGAVMGAKNLKAIAVKGNKKVIVHNKEKLTELIKQNVPDLKKYNKMLTDFGTAGGVQGVEANGDLPIRNWTLGSWEEGAAETCGQMIAQKNYSRHYSCYACPIRCGKMVEIRVGMNKGTISRGPEYETCAAFGSNLLNENLDYLCAANDYCNRLGLDTICTGNAVALAIECYENGLITKEDTGGLHLNWGDHEIILQLIEKIAYKKDIGAVLAQGVKKAAEQIGGLASEFAIHTKGLSYAFHDPRAFTGMALVYATGNRGACHLEGLTFFVESGGVPAHLIGLQKELERQGHKNKAELTFIMQNLMNSYNALGLCKFLIRGRIGPETIRNWVNAVTGWEIDESKFNLVGERLHNLKRMYNVRLGISRKDDTLPPRLLVHDRKIGASGGSLPHIGKMLSEYYEVRGWTPEGIPKPEKLKDLGLEN